MQRSNGSGRFFSLCKISSSGSNPSKYSKFQLSTRKSLASIHLRCLPLMQSFNKTLPSFFSSEAPILSDSKTENVSVDDTQKYNVENEFQKGILYNFIFIAYLVLIFMCPWFYYNLLNMKITVVYTLVYGF